MERKLLPVEKLDTVLSILSSDKACQYIDIENGLKDRGIDLTSEEIKNIIRKLDKDQNIEKLTYGYCLTFEGELLKQYGGYGTKALTAEGVAKLEQIELNRQRTLDRIVVKNGDRLNRLTLWLAIGTVALSLIEIAKIVTPAYQYFCHCQFVWQK